LVTPQLSAGSLGCGALSGNCNDPATFRWRKILVKNNPKQLGKISHEMNGVVAEYYNSVESFFELTVKFIDKSHPFDKYVYTPAIVLFFFTLLPLVPLFFNSLFPVFFPPQISLFKWTFAVASFFYWWALLAAVTFTLAKIAETINKKINKNFPKPGDTVLFSIPRDKGN
jgi:hypothetical protein